MAGGTGTSGRKVRIAVVGLGFGAEFIPIHQRHPDVELVAICQRSQDKLDKLGRQYGVERRYTSYADLLKATRSMPSTSIRRSPTMPR